MNKYDVNCLPDWQKKKIWEKAWEDGHSYGFDEVYSDLSELANLFEKDY
jgi:hypothetical protein